MKNVEDVYPLTPLQQGMLFHTLYHPQSGMYVEHISWTLRGELNASALETAWQRVVSRHPILRSAFFIEGLDQPLQVVRKQIEIVLERRDWRGLEPAEQQLQVQSFIQQDRLRGFELSRAPLMRLFLIRLDDDLHQLIWSHHHMLLDGWSTSLVLKDVLLFYEAHSRGESLDIEPTRPYRDYIAWMQKQNQSEAELFWRRMLKGFTAPTQLGLKQYGNGDSAREQGPDARQISVSAEATLALQSFARQNQLTLNTIAQGAWALLLSHYSGERDVAFGSIVSGRPADLAQIESMVGLFLNAQPVRVVIPADARLAEWLRDIQARQFEARQYEFSPLVQIQGWSDLPRGTPLFDNTLAFENFPAADVLREQQLSLTIENIIRYGSRSNYPINVVVEPGREMHLEIGYDRGLIEAETIERMLGHFKALLESMAANPERTLSEYSPLTEAERQIQLFDWNKTDTKYPENTCIHKLFEEQAAQTPYSIAVVSQGKELTYEDLNRRANQLAHYLIKKGVGPEVVVGISLERSAEMIIAILGVMKAGGGYVPLDPGYPKQRLAFMLEDAGVPVLLTQESLLDELPVHWAQEIVIDAGWDMIALESDENPDSEVSAGNLAYVIYTSGSTGKPKGVLIEHQGLPNLAQAQIRGFDLNQQSRVLQFASLSFDASVSEIFTTLLAGGSLYLDAKERLMSFSELAEVIESHRITAITLPPTVLSTLPAGSLNSLKTLVVAGEACSSELAAQWSGGRRFINAYGPTEASVCASMAQISVSDETHIGRPIDNVKIYILNPDMQPVPVGIRGEIYINSVGLARGYLNEPALTAERFLPDPFSNKSGARIYRTGDQASYLPDGNIEYHGRVDNQVKIHGYRIELGEIEAALRGHTALREAVVICDEDSAGGPRLVAYLICEPDHTLDVSDLRTFLQQRLPAYMTPHDFVMVESLPLTPAGKIDRLALRSTDGVKLQTGSDYVPPRTETEEVLAAIWSQVLGVDRVGIDDSFFALGGDSIRSVQVLSKAQERGLNFNVAQIFEHQTIRSVALYLASASKSETSASSEPFALISEADRAKLPGDVEDAYPLTRLQRGMVFHSDSRPDTAIYHSIISIRLLAPFDESALQATLNSLMSRHSLLRTSFDLLTFSEPLQLVHKAVEAPLQLEDLRDRSKDEQERAIAEWIEAEKRNHFDWSRPPLLRFTVHRLAEESLQFTFTAHHAIIDGWSDGLFLTELCRTYISILKGEHTENVSAGSAFRDYVALENVALASAEDAAYWKERLSESVVARLPRFDQDQSREEDQFGAVELSILPRISDALMKQAQSQAVPLKSILLAGHLKVMSVYSGQSDVVTGLVSNGRPEGRDSEQMIGLFLNTLPFRIKLRRGTWVELIQEVFDCERNSMPYRRFPLAQIQLDQGRKSLFETCFNYTHFHLFNADPVPGEMEVLDVTSVTETDLALMAHFSLDPHSSRLQLNLQYDARQLGRDQVEAIGESYLEVFESISADPQSRYDLETALPLSEMRKLLLRLNETEQDYPREACIQDLFETQAEKTPNELAVTYGTERLTFREVNQRANQIAHSLRRMGVGPETPVGICLNRSADMVISLLAILKAGGAYVPLPPSHPQERLSYIIEDASLKVAITNNEAAMKLPSDGLRLINLNQESELLASESVENPPRSTTPDNLAYILYTSGSTGQPKGILGLHRGAINRFHWMWQTYPFERSEVCCQKTSLSFVDCVWEIFGPLLQGIPLVIISDNDTKDTRQLIRTLGDNRVTRIVLVPSLLRAILDSEVKLRDYVPALKYWISSGEPLAEELSRGLKNSLLESVLINLYGSTEVSADATCFEVSGESASIPIGHPISNMQAYVLDENLLPVPVGVAGTLYVGGVGLARGYQGRSALTAEKFIPDPFSAELGGRLYNTGDIVFSLRSGELQYVGRADNQVKIRGFRIELEEIESVLDQHPAIGKSVILDIDSDIAGKQLIAYITLSDTERPDPDQLRSYIGSRLPDYMIPSAFIVIEQMPLTSSGKVDRRAVMKIEWEGTRLESEFVAPRTPIEEAVADIWAEVLDLETVGVESNFFDLGGHSLMATQILARVRAAMDVELSIADLLESPTVAAMAELIETAMDEDQDIGLANYHKA